MQSPPIHPPHPALESSGSPPSGESRSAPPTLDRQLARLYGESVFGPWLDPAQYMTAGRRQRGRGHWKKRLVIVLLSMLVLAAGVWLTDRGFSRAAEQDRANVAKDVTAFLAEGELERLAQFLAILTPPGKPLQATDPYLDLILQAEAALYRYYDASPARLARIAPYLSATGSAPTRLLARLTVASNAERLASYELLKGLQSTFAKDPELWTLMASVEERRDLAAAHESWQRSFDLGPLWLPHRYQQCGFEARHHHAEAVARITRHMAKVAPDSPWTRLALKLQDAGKPSAELPNNTTPPVAQYHQQLASVLENLRTGGSPASSRQALERALAAVSNEAAFVLDAFDRLMVAKAKDLASEITSFEAWPRGNAIAQAKLDELQLAASAPDTAATAKPTPPSTDSRNTTVSKATSKSKKAGAATKKKAGKAKRRAGRRRS
jgi:hypothetical protein